MFTGIVRLARDPRMYGSPYKIQGNRRKGHFLKKIVRRNSLKMKQK